MLTSLSSRGGSDKNASAEQFGRFLSRAPGGVSRVTRLGGKVNFTPSDSDCHRICSFALTNSHAFLNPRVVSIQLWIHTARQFANDSRPPPLAERRVCVFVSQLCLKVSVECWCRDSLKGWKKEIISPWEMFLWCCSNSVTRWFGHIFSCPCGWHLINWLDKHTRSLHVVMRDLISQTAATVVTAPLKHISSTLLR